MDHLLDNPAWNALISGNKELAHGNEKAKYFAGDVSPFVGVAEPTRSSFETLYEAISFDGNFAFITPIEVTIPAPWKIMRHITVLQMVCNKPSRLADADSHIVPLNDKHVPAMLALTKLTNPGPFFSRTIDFGHYSGIFDGDRLVAMAGQRMHPVPYAEISAVCTHPGSLGKGYAGKLILNQVERIKAQQGIPFLHVLTGNTRAIGLYESLGFVNRKVMMIYMLQKGNH